jgi:hypothetical protein
MPSCPTPSFRRPHTGGKPLQPILDSVNSKIAKLSGEYPRCCGSNQFRTAALCRAAWRSHRPDLARKTTTAESPHAPGHILLALERTLCDVPNRARNRIRVQAEQSRMPNRPFCSFFSTHKLKHCWVTRSGHRELPRKLPRFCSAGSELWRSLTNVISD